MDVSSIFAFSLIGALIGYILGDFQREVRIRRDVRANLALANDRDAHAHPDTDGYRAPVSGSDGHSHADSIAARSLGSLGNGETGRRAIPRADLGTRPAAAVRSRGVRRAAPASLMVDYDCG